MQESSLLTLKNIDEPIVFSKNIVPGYFPLHRHEYVEIVFVMDGVGREIVNGSEFAMTPGYFAIYMPWDAHEIFSINSLTICRLQCDYSLIFCGAKFIRNWDRIVAPQISQRLGSPCVQCLGDDFDTVSHIFSRISKDYFGTAGSKSQLIHLALFELIIRYQQIKDKLLSMPFISLGETSQTAFADFLFYIYANFTTSITLDEMAKKFHFSPSRCNEILKEKTGLSFFEILRSLRMEQAKRMLLQSDETDAAIAASVGFLHYVTFYRNFTEYVGLTPQQYREQCTQNTPVLWEDNLTSSVLEYLYANYTRAEADIDETAQKVGCSRASIEEVFKKTLKTSFGEILESIRVNHACSLLSTTDMPIIDIAVDVGMSTAKTLSRSFHKRLGIPPGEYRRRCANMEISRRERCGGVL